MKICHIIKHIFSCLIIQLTQLISGCNPAISLPCIKLLEHIVTKLFCKFFDRILIFYFLNKNRHTFQHHLFMVACYRYNIWHLHHLKERLYRVLSSVNNISQHIQYIFIRKCIISSSSINFPYSP